MFPRLIIAIVVLPGTVLVFIPVAILWLVAEPQAPMAIAGVDQFRFWIGILMASAGFAFAVWTVRLFVVWGEGTPAPWNPPKRLVVCGPYRHVRNPMITSVLAILGAESLVIGSWHLAGWMLVFLLLSTIYFSLVEEPGLEQRFGEDYRRYKESVPRWIPSRRPWEGP